MRRKNILSLLVLKFFKLFFSVKENPSKDIGNPKEILIVRQHNQFGDLLASTPMFRAIKEKYPECNITIIVSPQNYNAVYKNKYISNAFVFNKRKLFNSFYLIKLIKLLRKGYDLVIVPVTISISFTSNLLSRLSKSKIRIGPQSLDGEINDSAYFFDRRVAMNWKDNPNRYVADYGLDILRPFGIDTKNYQIIITIDEEDEIESQKFIEEIGFENEEKLVGLHVGAGKIQNRWDTNKFSSLIKLLKEKYKINFYFTGTDADSEQIQRIKEKINFEIHSFLNKNISQTASLISKSHLFITNDTGTMHVAGATDTPQISLFGPTNPKQWSPIGKKKYFLKVGENINSISVEEVFDRCKNLIEKKG